MNIKETIRNKVLKRQLKKNYEIDMCHGPLLGKILSFAFPLILSGTLQLFFNAADIIVVGQFAGATALAAVGSTGALINLILNLFMGFSIGANVLVARAYGSQDMKALKETVHTAVLLSLLAGCIMLIIGLCFAEPLLKAMGTPDDVLDQACLYIRIYFIGMPFSMLYNFGAAILRAVGDTKRPLYFLFIAGIVNVLLNLLLVIVFNLGVAGVGIATITSQMISSILVCMCLIKTEAPYKLIIKELRLTKDKLIAMARIGIPAGIQGAMFSFSNVIVQSTVNSFGSVAMAGAAASGNIEGFVYTSVNALNQTALSFTGQNIGGKKYSRVKKIYILCLCSSFVIGVSLSLLSLAFAPTLISIYNSDPEVIAFGVERMASLCVFYGFCVLMDTTVGAIRGLGYSMVPTLISIFAVCGIRLLWIFFVFPLNPTWSFLFIVYPISWAASGFAQLIAYFHFANKLPKVDG